MKREQLLLEPPANPWLVLTAGQTRDAMAISDFMLEEGRLNPDPTDTLQKMSTMFVKAGVPLDRTSTIVRLLHAESVASARTWSRREGTRTFTFPVAADSGEGYQRSPAALAHDNKKWVSFNPQTVGDDTFDIVAELRKAGICGYLCVPIQTVDQKNNMFSFATERPSGFNDQDIAFIRAAIPAIAACQEILVTHRMLHEVTRMYVGEEPHRRILEGDVHRGGVTRINSAILFADMRDFTSLTADMSAEDATALLNAYYDCVVPAIEGLGGEVLKFIGDGILAIFRADGDPQQACTRALEAAQQALAATASHSEPDIPKFTIGIALHFGLVAYGNVGSGMRLDYTVIGRDVNLASRVAGLCTDLGEPLLLSKALADQLQDVQLRTCGEQVLKGISGKTEIFAPGAKVLP